MKRLPHVGLRYLDQRVPAFAVGGSNRSWILANLTPFGLQPGKQDSSMRFRSVGIGLNQTK